MILGNKEEFALECVVDNTESEPSDYIFGHIALWAGKFMIGDFTQTVILDVPYDYFKNSLVHCGQRKDPILMKMTTVEAWQFLNLALYGHNDEDDVNLDQLDLLEEKYRKFCICPGFSEAFDGETAFLIEDEQGERFIWKDFTSQLVREVRLKPETYKRTIESFIAWYSTLNTSN